MFAPIQKKLQVQKNPFAQAPFWVWISIGLGVVAIGIIWTLREEEAQKQYLRKPPPPPDPEPAAPQAKPAPKPAPPRPDNLKLVRGIGPKIMQTLNENGIYTFEQLAATDVSFLENLVKSRRWNMANFDTWPAQAKELAAKK